MFSEVKRSMANKFYTDNNDISRDFNLRSDKKYPQTVNVRRNRLTLKIDVAFTSHSHIIGKGGHSIQKVMDDTSTHIHFPDSNRRDMFEKSNQVTIAGESVDNVWQALKRVRQLLPFTVYFELPLTGLDTNRFDMFSPEIQSIRQKYGIDINIRLSHPAFVNGQWQFFCRPGSVSSVNGQGISSTGTTPASVSQLPPNSTGNACITVRGSNHQYQSMRKGFDALIHFLTVDSGQQMSLVLINATLDIAPQHHDFVRGENDCNIDLLIKKFDVIINFPDMIHVDIVGGGTTPTATNWSDGQPISSSSLVSLAKSSTNGSYGFGTPLSIRKSTVVITGASYDSVFRAWQEILGYLPVVLVFDLPLNAQIDGTKLAKVIDEYRVQIQMKRSKPAQSHTQSCTAKACERNVELLFAIRSIILGSNQTGSGHGKNSTIGVPIQQANLRMGNDEMMKLLLYQWYDFFQALNANPFKNGLVARKEPTNELTAKVNEAWQPSHTGETVGTIYQNRFYMNDSKTATNGSVTEHRPRSVTTSVGNSNTIFNPKTETLPVDSASLPRGASFSVANQNVSSKWVEVGADDLRTTGKSRLPRDLNSFKSRLWSDFGCPIENRRDIHEEQMLICGQSWVHRNDVNLIDFSTSPGEPPNILERHMFNASTPPLATPTFGESSIDTCEKPRNSSDDKITASDYFNQSSSADSGVSGGSGDGMENDWRSNSDSNSSSVDSMLSSGAFASGSFEADSERVSPTVVEEPPSVLSRSPPGMSSININNCGQLLNDALIQSGLEKYIEFLWCEKIDLNTLTDSQLMYLGVPYIDRRKLLAAIDALKRWPFGGAIPNYCEGLTTAGHFFEAAPGAERSRRLKSSSPV